MSELIYEEPREYTREEAAKIFASEDVNSICSMMVGLAYHDKDWKWVQDHCLRLSCHADPQFRYIAALCISHLARIHGELDLAKVRPMLLGLEQDPEQSVRASATDMIEDVEHFMNINLRKPSEFN